MGYKIDNNTKKISLTRGDTLRLAVSINKGNETYTPTESDSIKFTMKQTYSTDVVTLQKIIPNDTMVLYIAPSDTRDLRIGSYVYDIEITFENGDVDTFISGVFQILPDVG